MAVRSFIDRLLDRPCSCKGLKDAIDDADFPIYMDKLSNSICMKKNVEPDEKWRLFYCPFCGGRIPWDFPKDLFMTITEDEKWRLRKLTRNLKTREHVIEAFGEPDFTGDSMETHFLKRISSEFSVFKEVLWYSNLSPMAHVNFMIDDSGQVTLMLTPKEMKERNE